MKKIDLTQGYTAIIDEKDAKRVREHSWAAHVDDGGEHVYACSTLGTGEGTVYLHRFLTEPDEDEDVIFRNGDGLDCRRENLVVLSHSESRARQKTRCPGRGSDLRGIRKTPNGRWNARLSYEGEDYYLGRFDEEAEAARAWLRKAEAVYPPAALPDDLPHRRFENPSASTDVGSETSARTFLGGVEA